MCEQISLLPDLDRASDTLKAKLCKTWPNAITNESNVYVCNRRDFCLPCYEKRLKKADEIIRGFIAEGWEEVAPEDYKFANSETNGWIDERNMDPFEPRKGKRFFTIDKVNLKWRCFFKREGRQQ